MNRELEHRERVINYYNITQPFYKRFWYGGKGLGLHYGFWAEGVSNRQEAIIKENEVLADLVGVQEGDLVLDAGCGVSGSGLWLVKERDAQVVGLNIVQNQLTIGRNLAKKRDLLKHLSFIRGDYHKLPLQSEKFDVFWSLESIEHATNVNNFIEEAFRVLKPQGKIVIAGTFRGSKELSDKEKRRVAIGFHLWGPLATLETAQNVSQVMQEIGFASVQNVDRTAWIMKSAQEMTAMCRWGLPVAKILSAFRLTSPLMVLNNQWGVYQEGLFKSGAISYNVLLARKP